MVRQVVRGEMFALCAAALLSGVLMENVLQTGSSWKAPHTLASSPRWYV